MADKEAALLEVGCLILRHDDPGDAKQLTTSTGHDDGVSIFERYTATPIPSIILERKTREASDKLPLADGGLVSQDLST